MTQSEMGQGSMMSRLAPARGARRWSLARVPSWACPLAAALAVVRCAEPTAIVEPPYIAIIPVITAAPGTDIGTQYTYRITEISGTLHFDKVRQVAPRDTVIVPVQPATYRITLTGFPPQCLVRDGTEIYLLVPANSNTAVWRFLISCESLLTVTTGTDGSQPDSEYIWSVKRDGATVRSGILRSNDTTRLDDLASGEYEVDLGHVAGNCVLTNDGGRRKRFTITGQGGGRADFRIVCSDPAARPTLLAFASSYHDGTSGFLIRAADPNGDIERYFWDITDCQGASVLPGGGRLRRGLETTVPNGPDTVTVLGAIELGLPDADLRGRCTSIRLEDEYGNSTPVLEELIGNETGAGPSPDSFNALVATTASLTTTLLVSDPQYQGVFVAATLRDGILFPPDGQPDLGIFNTTGYERDVLIPPVPLGGGLPEYYDYYSVIAYLFNTAGNFTRIEDNDLFH